MENLSRLSIYKIPSPPKEVSYLLFDVRKEECSLKGRLRWKDKEVFYGLDALLPILEKVRPLCSKCGLKMTPDIKGVYICNCATCLKEKFISLTLFASKS